MEIDITIEFYHKEAMYVSPITKAEQFIKIKKVVIEIDYDRGFIGRIKTKYCTCFITSTNGVIYELSQLKFQ